MRVLMGQSVIIRLRFFAAAWLGRLRARRALRRQTAAAQGVIEPAAVRDTFCVLAWNHLQIAPNGTVKMCCIAGEDLQEKGRTMSLYTDTYEEIWNSGYMRDARRG